MWSQSPAGNNILLYYSLPWMFVSPVAAVAVAACGTNCFSAPGFMLSPFVENISVYTTSLAWSLRTTSYHYREDWRSSHRWNLLGSWLNMVGHVHSLWPYPTEWDKEKRYTGSDFPFCSHCCKFREWGGDLRFTSHSIMLSSQMKSIGLPLNNKNCIFPREVLVFSI